MTRKEFETMLQKDLQTANIPDKNALWEKIESRLPEQQAVQPVKIRKTSFVRSVMTAVACLAVLLAGVQFWNHQQTRNQTAENSTTEIADEPEQPSNQPIAYQNLNLSHDKSISSQADLTRLGTKGEYFNEDDILAKTDFFLDVKVLDGFQEESGKMSYTLQIIDVYGGTLSQKEITLETDSAYLLEKEHEYVIPVSVHDKEFALSYGSAPQIEKTNDNQLVIPNGWYTLMQGSPVPVKYDRYGTDDYFYDRMYLTGNQNLELLIQKWETL